MAGMKRGHGEGSVYQITDGTWRASLTMPMGQGGGRRSFRAKTRQEVLRKLAAAKRAVEDGALPLGDARQTVGDYLASWLQAMRPNIEEGTWLRDEQYVRTHVAPFLGHLRLSAVTVQHLQALYADRMEAGGLSSTTVHHIHSRLHKAFADAERLGLVVRNVAERAVPPRARKVDIRPLTREQARELLAVTGSDRMSALYSLALASGMRQGELLGLCWPDVDLDAGVVHVRTQLKHEKDGWTLRAPKTRRSRRQIAMPVAMAAALRAHRAAQAVERLRLGVTWGVDVAWASGGERACPELVFCTRAGRPIRARNLLRRFKQLLEAAGLPDIRFHDLRHTAATLLLAARVNPKVVSEMLGHASVAITLDIYSHVLPDMQQDAAATMGQVLFG